MTYREEDKHYVYELRDLDNNIIYVGETAHPRSRFNRHVCVRGKFAGMRDHLRMELISSHDTRKEALVAEGIHKQNLGIVWSEKEHQQKQGRKRARFDKAQIDMIKKMSSEGSSQGDISKQFGVSQSAISRILNNKFYNYDI